jgi:hypothetical protein
MSLQLLIPRSATRTLRCAVPGCGKDFPLDQHTQFVRHVKACAKRNHDRFEEAIAKKDETYFTSSADPELRDHLKAGGN